MRALLLVLMLAAPLVALAPIASAGSNFTYCTPTTMLPAPQPEACASHEHDTYCVTATLGAKTLYQYCKWFLGP